MTDTSSGQRLTGWRARRSRPEEPKSYRLAASVRIPVIAGSAALLVGALAIGVLVGRVEDGELEVPGVVLDSQEAITREVAQSIRRGVNEGVADLEQAASVMGQLEQLDPAALTDVLEAVATTHGRYLSLAVVGPDGVVVASTGAPPELDVVDEEDLFAEAGTSEAVEDDGVPLIVQWAPIDGEGPLALLAHYDYAFLRFPMEVARPGSAWLVDDDSRIIAATGGFSPFTELPRRSLREAAASVASGGAGAGRGGGSADEQEIVGKAPVSGLGPAGGLGWGVVTSRQVGNLSLPQTNARREALVAAASLAVITLAVFGWLWLLVVRPVVRLQKEAERIAFGDLSDPVEIIRYDEIGLIARSLERIRVALIRRRLQG